MAILCLRKRWLCPDAAQLALERRLRRFLQDVSQISRADGDGENCDERAPIAEVSMWQLLLGDHAFADALMRPDHGYASKRCAPVCWQSLRPCWPAVRTRPSSTRPSARRSRSRARPTCRAM